MSTFTMKLKDVVGHVPDTFMQSYPLFDETYRDALNKKIVQHFWNQEIGVESVPLFTFKLDRKLNEIMPYYNQLYTSTQIKFDPLSTMDMTNVSNGTTSQSNTSIGKSDSTGDTKATSISVNNDFPQTALDPNESDGSYATNSNESNSDGVTTSNANDSRTDSGAGSQDTTSISSGYVGSAADLLTRYRAAILNVDMMVIADLQSLFMSVWDNGDTFTESGYYL